MGGGMSWKTSCRRKLLTWILTGYEIWKTAVVQFVYPTYMSKDCELWEPRRAPDPTQPSVLVVVKWN